MLDFVRDNVSKLRHQRNGARMVDQYGSLRDKFDNGWTLTPGEKRLVEVLYEKVFAGDGLPSVNTHVDRKRRGLRFG